MRYQFNFEEYTFRVFHCYFQEEEITSLTPESFLYHNKYQRLRQLVWRLCPKNRKKLKEREKENEA
jgi:hypothetical protein